MEKKFNSDGQLHCEDGAAIIYEDGYEYWINGKRHRENDLPAVEFKNEKRWYVNGQLHREDGAAIIYEDGNKTKYEYWINGIRHSDSEPAKMITENGVITHTEYYLHGVKYRFEDWEHECNKTKWNLL